MTAPLFLADIAGVQVGDLVTLAGTEGRHAAVVKRLQTGEAVILSDGAGHGVSGAVVAVTKTGITVQVSQLLTAPAPSQRWVGVQALAKGDRSEIAIEALTELGVAEILAWQAARSVVRWDADRETKGLAKWQSTVREAAKQSRRLVIPPVSAVTTAQLVTRIAGAARAFVLHEQATQPLGAAELPVVGEVLFIVGPEGGITDQELAAFTQAGARPVRVSDAVLRTSTAGVVGLAQLQLMALER